ncbi:hypothetical protein ACWDOR_18945 [Streptosporangium canum]|uniref:hypothetical protein n=1 Tax=Streptosporangium canum TaxID=324952 RepID=UPI003694B2DC
MSWPNAKGPGGHGPLPRGQAPGKHHLAFARYSRDGSFAVLGANVRFIAIMTAGSITGALAGGLLLGVIPDLVLIPILAVVLLISAVKLARHAPPDA